MRGSFLSDSDIVRELGLTKEYYSGIESGNTVPSPELEVRIGDCLVQDDPEFNHHITPVGYDLTLTDSYQIFSLTKGAYLEFEKSGSGRSYVSIPSGHTVSVHTSEYIAMGKNVGGLICSCVSLVRQGASHISTTIDPTWKGHLLLTFTNNSPIDMVLGAKEKIATAVFFYTNSPSCVQKDIREVENYREEYDKIARKYKEIGSKLARKRMVISVFLILIALLLILFTPYLLGMSELQASTITALEKGANLIGGVISTIGVITALKFKKD